MANISAVGTYPNRGVVKLVWSSLTNSDTALSQSIPDFPDKTVQVDVTAGTPTCVLQGSNDASTWHTLVDPQGNNISFTADGIEQVLENTQYIRPAITAGTGTVTVTVIGNK